MLDENVSNNINSFNESKCWDLLQNELVYFFCTNGTYTSFINSYVDRNPGSPVVLKDYVEIFNKYVNKELLNEKESLKQKIEELLNEKESLKQKIEELLNEKESIKQKKEELLNENELLKQKIEELKKYEEYSKKFLSLEPKKKLKLNKSEIEQIKISRQNGMTIKELAKNYDVSYKTIYNYLKK